MARAIGRIRVMVARVMAIEFIKGQEGNKENGMKTILVAMLVAAGIGIVGLSGASAAPANGTAINRAANSVQLTEPAHCRPGWFHHQGGTWDGCYRERSPFPYIGRVCPPGWRWSNYRARCVPL